MPRPLVWTLYGCLIAIWSSTWVAIKIGLEDLPPLLGAGIRFGLAGLGLLVIARVMGRPLRTDARLAAVLALLPFAAAYGLIYWGEQYVPSGLAAVLFGVMPLYSAVLAALLLAPVDQPVCGRERQQREHGGQAGVGAQRPSHRAGDQEQAEPGEAEADPGAE